MDWKHSFTFVYKMCADIFYNPLSYKECFAPFGMTGFSLDQKVLSFLLFFTPFPV